MLIKLCISRTQLGWDEFNFVLTKTIQRQQKVFKVRYVFKITINISLKSTHVSLPPHFYFFFTFRAMLFIATKYHKLLTFWLQITSVKRHLTVKESQQVLRLSLTQLHKNSQEQCQTVPFVQASLDRHE